MLDGMFLEQFVCIKMMNSGLTEALLHGLSKRSKILRAALSAGMFCTHFLFPHELLSA